MSAMPARSLPPSPPLASELYATSQGVLCSGPHECYWCGAPCKDTMRHSEPPPGVFPGAVQKLRARRPANPYVCVACWLYRRGSVSLRFLGEEGWRDRQRPANHSWLLTPEQIVCVAPEKRELLYETLFNPPRTFALSLVTAGTENLLQLAVANDHATLAADTELVFTLDGVIHFYTVYELGEVVKKGGDADGTEPGVQALVRFLGKPPIEPAKEEKRGRGRPKLEMFEDRVKPLKKVLAKSGA